MKQLTLFIDLAPSTQSLAEQRARAARADELMHYVDLLARIPDAPPELLEDLRALADVRRHGDDDSLAIANAAIWPDMLAWLYERVRAMPDGRRKDAAHNAWIKAKRRAWFTFPEYWFLEVLWRTQ